jgi:hypothetical protein
MIKKILSDYGIMQMPTEYHSFFRVLIVVICWRYHRFYANPITPIYCIAIQERKEYNLSVFNDF